MTDRQWLKSQATFRADFPALERWLYLDVAARGIISKSVRNAIDDNLDDAMHNGATKDAWFEQVERTRSLFAATIHASTDEIAFTKNCSDGINLIANAVRWERGDNVILCEELEHPNNVYPWLHLRDAGVEVRAVPSSNHEIDVDAICARIDERTRVVAVSNPTFSPGHATQLAQLGRACRRMNAFFLVDAAQSVGVSVTDVRAHLIDGLVTSTQKGLLALYGMGFLFVDRRWWERLRPPFIARFSVDLGEAHEADAGGRAYRLHPSARRYEIGNYNYVATAAAEASMTILHELGIERIEQHVLRLASRLRGGLQELGLPVAIPSLGSGSHIVTVGYSGETSLKTGGESSLLHLHSWLSDRGVKSSWRRGGIRFSVHAYNNDEDIDRALSLVEMGLES